MYRFDVKSTVRIDGRNYLTGSVIKVPASEVEALAPAIDEALELGVIEPAKDEPEFVDEDEPETIDHDSQDGAGGSAAEGAEGDAGKEDKDGAKAPETSTKPAAAKASSKKAEA